MSDRDDRPPPSSAPEAPTILELGGLRFHVSFRSAGATLRVEGLVDHQWTEMLRFDDFVESPHFHAPATGSPIPFDRTTLGEPLAWFITQVRDHLAEWMERAGFGDVLGTVDVATVSANAPRLTEAMISCVPATHVRVPGVGLQRSEMAS